MDIFSPPLFFVSTHGLSPLLMTPFSRESIKSSPRPGSVIERCHFLRWPVFASLAFWISFYLSSAADMAADAWT